MVYWLVEEVKDRKPLAHLHFEEMRDGVEAQGMRNACMRVVFWEGGEVETI